MAQSKSQFSDQEENQLRYFGLNDTKQNESFKKYFGKYYSFERMIDFAKAGVSLDLVVEFGKKWSDDIPHYLQDIKPDFFTSKGIKNSFSNFKEKWGKQFTLDDLIKISKNKTNNELLEFGYLGGHLDIKYQELDQLLKLHREGFPLREAENIKYKFNLIFNLKIKRFYLNI